MMCIDIKPRNLQKKKMFRYLNSYCTEKCINNLIDGKLQCDCGDSGLYDWTWEKQSDSSVVVTNREVIFHPVYSSGTAALRGSEPFKKNAHHFWEMKMLSNLYGTDVMVGVGTSKIIIADWRFRFFSLLGWDSHSWGYSYNGTVQHNNITQCYGSKFGIGSLIGVHLDMCSGTLEYYLNRKPLGIAFEGLKNEELYPMICSTAAQSSMKMTCATSVQPSLQLACMQCIVKNSLLYDKFKSIPGLARIYEKTYFWLLPKEETEDSKRKAELDKHPTSQLPKRRKLFLPIRWTDRDAEEHRVNFFLHFLSSDDSDSDGGQEPSTSH